MAAKFALVCILSLFFIHVATSALIRQVRDTSPTAPNIGKAIGDAIQTVKSGFDDMLKNSNDILKDFTGSIEKFGDSIQGQGEDLVEKAQESPEN